MKYKSPRVFCVCVFCRLEQKEASIIVLNVAGWKLVKDSQEINRTHFGWCPDCAKKFGVE